MSVLERIKQLAAEKHVTIAAIEQSVGLGNGTIGRWSTSSPSLDKLEKVASYFDVSMDYLAGKTEDRSSHHNTEGKSLPPMYFHMLKGFAELDLSESDVSFLLDVAKRYKMNDTKEEEKK